MKIILNKLLPFKSFIAINLFGFLFVRKEKANKLSEIIINHEMTHTLQMKEMLYIFFYLWYVIEWLIKLVYYKDFIKAYNAISFEREAYFNQYKESYNKNRKHYSWLKFI